MLVQDLRQVGRGDLALAGGKGANLGELLRAGFPVPPGFVVTTAAYDEVVSRNGRGEIIARALRAERDPGAVIRNALGTAPIPTDVAQEILAAYERLGEGPVAVRSSATAEDLPDAAFAGQQDTFLNVVGTDAVLRAVRRCWASLWTDRAIAYRARQSLDPTAVKLAVVVQRMVPAEVAGVMFTANPVTGARDEVVIDLSPGLGEAVVSGLVTPDHVVLRKRRWGWRTVERRLGRRELEVRPREGGGTESVVAAPALVTPALSDRDLRRLARLGVAIERRFGAPQDVEWAWRDGAFFIVQARPMTAVPVALRLPRAVAAMAAELFPVRPYPFDLTTWGPAVFQAIAPVVEVVGVAVDPVNRVFVQENGVAIGLTHRPPLRPTLKVLLAPLLLARRIGAYDPTRWKADPGLAAALERARRLGERDPAVLDWSGLLDLLRSELTLPRALAGEVRARYFPRALLAALVLRLVLRALGRRDQFGVLLSGIETKTLEANRALETLAAAVRADPVLADTFAAHEAGALPIALAALPSGQAWLNAFRDFLDRYGHREAAITTIALPPWRDAPETALGIVKGLALAPPRPPFERSGWEQARDDVLTSPLLRPPLIRSVFLGLLADARTLLQLREDTHFYATLALPLVRRTLLELGRRLVQVGALDEAEGVFHLTLQDLEGVSSWPPPESLTSVLRTLVQSRRARRVVAEQTPLVALARPATGAAADDAVLARGTPGSPGVAEGAVRVIHGGAEFGALKPGEVLVAPYTNPGWTPLFQRAAAVVVDSGGAGSHAAIVAREYGIPAVMGTVDGTRRLVDGQRVRVDGGRGMVFAASPPGAATDPLDQPGAAPATGL